MKPISRKEALELSREILERAEDERMVQRIESIIYISDKSVEYAKEALSHYKLIDLNQFRLEYYGTIILHIYPTKDTLRDDSDYIDGYDDSLLFDLHIYDLESLTKQIVCGRDQIELRVPANARVFKDGSTMIVIKGPTRITLYQSVEVERL